MVSLKALIVAGAATGLLFVGSVMAQAQTSKAQSRAPGQLMNSPTAKSPLGNQPGASEFAPGQLKKSRKATAPKGVAGPGASAFAPGRLQGNPRPGR